jgi:hypothetical protein
MCKECNQKIHNRGARKKHKRFPKFKIEPYFLIDRRHPETEDSVPNVGIHQPLFTIDENVNNTSGDHNVDVNNIDNSSGSSKKSNINPLTLHDASLPQALSTK